MILVKEQISDRRILKMICKCLKTGIMEKSGVISTLLFHYLDTIWERHYSHFGKLIRYCDDFVVISRTKKEAQHALKTIKHIMIRLELDLHPDKTKLVSIWDAKEEFDFLGFHHKRKTTETSK